MPDILPPEAFFRQFLEQKARILFQRFGYEEIRTPILEETGVFTRSIGEDTDIVEKEMYSFVDRGGKQVSLRPEGTASIIRAYIEHGWHNSGDICKLFYLGPMFRGERPQKGRLRQFHQIGVEIIGSTHPYVDAELIVNIKLLLNEFGINDFTILINSLGCAKDRMHFKKALQDYLSTKDSKLCDNCRRRAKINVLRVLDCKNTMCREVVKKAPNILSYLCDGCKKDYVQLKDMLSEMEVSFKEKTDLVRGLDYYTGIVFEIIHPLLGAQDAIAAGGRYDALVKQMGGPDIGATGYAVGVERLLLIAKQDTKVSLKRLLIIPIKDEYLKDAFLLARKFWQNKVSCDVDHMKRSFKGQMRKAHKEKRKFVAIIGEDELKQGKLLLKDMETGEQELISFEEAVGRLTCRDRACPCP
ncbi:MAG: histidine--tRNA ligase [Candidatus Omnitrophica bacterium]|nr:histidine--tRNA ligase [Candidatus Omnitrophota bacterium]